MTSNQDRSGAQGGQGAEPVVDIGTQEREGFWQQPIDKYTQPAQQECDRGLPDVGTVCEYQLKHDEPHDEWSRCVIEFVGDRHIVAKCWPDEAMPELEQCFTKQEVKFRPLKPHPQPAQIWQDVEPVAFGIFYDGVFQEHARNRDAAEAIALEDYTGLDGVTVEPIYTHPQPAQQGSVPEPEVLADAITDRLFLIREGVYRIQLMVGNMYSESGAGGFDKSSFARWLAGALRDLLPLTAPRTAQQGSVPEDIKERLRDAISEALGEALDCTRVWEAWGYGTMSQNDFQPVNDDPDRLEELVDAVLSVMATTPQAEGWIPAGWKLAPIESTSEMDLAAEDADLDKPVDRDHAEAIWSAMIAAAPQPPAQGGEGDEH